MYLKMGFLSGMLLLVIAGVLVSSYPSMRINLPEVDDLKQKSNDIDELQIIYKSGTLQGIHSFEGERIPDSKNFMRKFFAVWYKKPVKNKLEEEGLVIYEKTGNQLKEKFRYIHEKYPTFLGFVPLSPGMVSGIGVKFSSEDYWTGETLVIALVDDKFKIVYEGTTSELVDLNGDGILEIFESFWTNGDGDPEKTIVHVWDGKAYRKLNETTWKNRFSLATQTLVEKTFKIR